MKITLSKYIEISELDYKDINYETNIIEIGYDLSHGEIEELNIDDFQTKITNIDKQLSIRTIASNSKIDGNNLIFDTNSLTFGQYIDCEAYLKDKKYNEFLQVFFNLNNINFYDSAISIFFNAYDEFTKFQKLIFTSYKSLFGGIEEDINEEIEEELISPTKRFKDNQEKIKQEIQKKWSWHLICFNLSQKSIIKMDEVYSLNFIKVLNILLMIKELEIDLSPTPYNQI